jgi:hypothetical protein
VPGPTARLCVLGAGACNDLDLERLADAFAEIHLVDIDARALAGAVARQSAAVRARLHRHALDLSGLSPARVRRWARVPPPGDEVAAVGTEAERAILSRLPGPFDVVASACVLTQMSFALRTALGERNPMLESARLALMATHLNTLVGLTAADGTSLLITDMVSSSHHPLDDLPGERALEDVMAEVVRSGACYFAANPEVLGALLAQVGAPELLPPWLWAGPLARTYLVYALRLSRGQRRAA